MTLNYLMARLQPWRFRKCGVPLHFHFFQVHSDPGVGVTPPRVLSMGQIEQTVCKQMTDVKL